MEEKLLEFSCPACDDAFLVGAKNYCEMIERGYCDACFEEELAEAEQRKSAKDSGEVHDNGLH